MHEHKPFRGKTKTEPKINEIDMIFMVELCDIYLIFVARKWMDIICLITIINHPTEMRNSKVQFKIDP